ncbi:MAG: DMT family transporter [Phenylobacterium sp.]|uniref:DMT family transporter n=1 Tax=Phenylobacterium sp. TaxID=1871053 RepID=UPI002727D0AD|nr:DMT family transporter [Phenylobacterium sp.]MDO9431672.1 DMT family transporter [Phenylobacterium sp.]
MSGQMVRGVANGVLAGAVWGLVFLAPQVLGEFSPFQLSAARYLAYGVVAMLLLAPRWRPLVARLGRAEWLSLFRLSLLGNILYYVLLAAAVQWAGGASASLIVGLLPVVLTVVGSREAGAVSFRALAPSMVLCLAGVGLVAFEAFRLDTGHGDPIFRLLGLACAVGALGSWSAYSVDNARWLARRPDISSHDWSLLTGVVTGALALLLAIPAFWGGSSYAPGEWARFWGVAAGVAILASVVGNGLWNQASRLLPLTLSGQMIVFETLFALLYGFLWSQRWPTGLEVLAIGCLVAGVLWCASLHRTPQVSPAE